MTAGSGSVKATVTEAAMKQTATLVMMSMLPSDSEQPQEPVKQNGESKHDEVPPTPQPADQNSGLLVEALMDQAMALDSSRNYSASNRVKVADVDSAHKDKTEISKPLKMSCSDHSLTGQSKAKRVVSRLKQ